jgi:Leucine-rich repeat (LRR) protein
LVNTEALHAVLGTPPLRSLRRFTLDEVSVSPAAADQIARWLSPVRLERLALTDTALQDVALANLLGAWNGTGRLSALTSLDLSDNQLTALGFATSPNHQRRSGWNRSD